VIQPAIKVLLLLFFVGNFLGVENHTDRLLSRGMELLKEGKIEQALPLLERSVVENPASAKAHNSYGSALGKTGAFPKAISEFKKALDLVPHYPEALFNLGATLAQTGDLEGAIVALRTATQQRPAMVEAYLELGSLFARIGDNAQALAQYRGAVAVAPNSVEARIRLGNALKQDDNIDDSIAEYRRALSVDGNSLSAIRSLAQAMRDQHDWEGAAELHRRLVSLQPNSGESHADLGYVLRRADRLSEALEVLRRAVALSPEVARAHFYLADTLAQVGDSTAALQEYEKSSLLDPKDPEITLKYGLALSKDRPKDAIVLLRRSVELDPKNPAAHRSLGSLLGRTGDMEGSSAAFQRAQELSAESDRHSEVVVHTKVAIQLLRKNDVVRAIEELRSALAIEADSADANHLLGVALSAIGKGSEAQKAFVAALEKRPADAEIHFNFGVFLARQADWQGAVRELRQVVALRPGHTQAHCLLANALGGMGNLEAAQKELKLAREFGHCELESTR
jgi:tetratricopeptide (TPR) repeat protein